jgi:RHS repeat-associated protein
VTDTYRYDAFGAIRSHTGGSPNEWLLTGEQLDPTGLYYLRARYYDPATGRFLTQDPLGSLQPYAYAANNPLRWVDPWGLHDLEATPTPTPVGMIQVCTVSPEGCEPTGLWTEIPRGGGGAIDWGGVVKAWWRFRLATDPYYLTYRAAREVVPPAWEFATTRSAQCYGMSAGTALYAGAAVLAYRAENVSEGQALTRRAVALGASAVAECRK